jgi:hypothetical protein
VLSLELLGVREGLARPSAAVVAAAVKVVATPQSALQGLPRVEDQGDGNYRLVVPLGGRPPQGGAEGVRLAVSIGGRELRGSPIIVSTALRAYRARFDKTLHTPSFNVDPTGRIATLEGSQLALNVIHGALSGQRQLNATTPKSLWGMGCLSPALSAGGGGGVYLKIAFRADRSSSSRPTSFMLGVTTREAGLESPPHLHPSSHFFLMNGTVYSGGRPRAAGAGSVFGPIPSQLRSLSSNGGMGGCPSACRARRGSSASTASPSPLVRSGSPAWSCTGKGGSKS